MFDTREEPGCDTLRVPVLKVFDGDGFLTTLGKRQVAVRFGFTDAPEMEQPGGVEARAFLQSLVSNRWAELVVLVKNDTGGIFDKYGRIVCVPYVNDDEGFGALRNVELEMIVHGWTWVLERYGPDERYLDALADARRHRRGIWAFAKNMHPWDFKKQMYRSREKASSSGQLNFF